MYHWTVYRHHYLARPYIMHYYLPNVVITQLLPIYSNIKDQNVPLKWNKVCRM